MAALILSWAMIARAHLKFTSRRRVLLVRFGLVRLGRFSIGFIITRLHLLFIHRLYLFVSFSGTCKIGISITYIFYIYTISLVVCCKWFEGVSYISFRSHWMCCCLWLFLVGDVCLIEHLRMCEFICSTKRKWEIKGNEDKLA